MCETKAMFRPPSIGHAHVLVACDLTQRERKREAGKKGGWEGGREGDGDAEMQRKREREGERERKWGEGERESMRNRERYDCTFLSSDMTVVLAGIAI